MGSTTHPLVRLTNLLDTSVKLPQVPRTGTSTVVSPFVKTKEGEQTATGPSLPPGNKACAVLGQESGGNDQGAAHLFVRRGKRINVGLVMKIDIAEREAPGCQTQSGD